MDRFYFALPLLLSACAAPDWKEDLDRLRDTAAALPVMSESAPRAPSSDAEIDRQLEGPLDLATLVRIARARNPELREASALTRAAIENVAGRRSLDDPIFKIETEGVPLSH